MIRLLLLTLLICRLSAETVPAPTPWPGSSVVFQYATTKQISEKKNVTAYLWLPPATTTVRGLVIGGTVLFEGGFAAHPEVRAACAAAGLGIVLFSPHLDAMFNATTSAEPLQQMLDDLAAQANHPELAQAPLLPFGHSIATIWTRNVLFWKPERCFGGIFFKGGFGVPEGHTISEIAGIPLFHLQGRFEEFGPASDGALRKDQGENRLTGSSTAMRDLSALRAANPDFLIGLAIEDGSTHFALSDSAASLLAEYIVGAAAQRIADDGSLRKVAPAAGALTLSGDLFATQRPPPAASDAWSGDKTTTFWHVSVALAEQAESFHVRFAGRKPQYVSADGGKGKPIAVGPDLRLKLNQVTWVGADEFRLSGAFWSTVPDLYPPQEGPVTNAAGAVQMRIFAGPLEQLGPDHFRVTSDRRLGDRPFVLFWHPGDAQHRAAEQPANLRVPTVRQPDKDGSAQTITWDASESVTAAALPLALVATSSSGLPVRFHVDHGPARVREGRLELADVPAKAVWPLRLTVVASQYGSALTPKFASATPIERTILVTQ